MSENEATSEQHRLHWTLISDGRLEATEESSFFAAADVEQRASAFETRHVAAIRYRIFHRRTQDFTVKGVHGVDPGTFQKGLSQEIRGSPRS